MLDTTTNVDLRECKLLLIERDRSAREIVQRMLGTMDITMVTAVSNAETGWNYLVGEKSKPFHLVITDLTLPGISGSTLIKKFGSCHRHAPKRCR